MEWVFSESCLTHLAGGSHGSGQGVDPLAVLGELLLVLERRRLQLPVHGGQLSQQRLLPLVGPDGLLLALPVQDDQPAVQRAVVRLQGEHAAVALQLLLPQGQHQAAAAVADPHRPVVARLPHVGVQVPQAELLRASLIAALGRGEVARLRVLGQMLQLHHRIAASGVVVAFDLQLQDQVLQRQDVVQLPGGDPLTLDGAAALLDDPGQHAARAEDVAARRRQRLLQHFVAQVALEVRVHGPLEAVQLKSHDDLPPPDPESRIVDSPPPQRRGAVSAGHRRDALTDGLGAELAAATPLIKLRLFGAFRSASGPSWRKVCACKKNTHLQFINHKKTLINTRQLKQ